jgi:uncharacterized repeat protein (TIGR03803 family)
MPRSVRFGLIIANAALLVACASSQMPLGAPPQTVIAPNTASETVLYSFAGGTDGADPDSAPILIRGKFYGTTALGGNGGCGFVHGCGTVYTLNASGQERVLHVFKGGKDGEAPSGPLIDVHGNLVGTTVYGGGRSCKDGHVSGCGTVFEVTRSGRERVLYSFPGRALGAMPVSGFTRFKDTFYGEAAAGGLGKCYYADYRGCGLIFTISSGDPVNIVYTFKGGASGGTPQGGLLPYKENLYGTTLAGGDNACMNSYGCGTAFEITPSGKLTTLHAFGRTLHDAALPENGLVRLNRAFYGTTDTGGSHNCIITGYFLGCGTVFKLTPSGKFTLLHSFTGSDGVFPNGLIAVNGNLYGTAGTSYGCGTVFKITPSGKETTLYQFKGGSDGCGPSSSLIYAGGTFFGTTGEGGTFNNGTIFAVTP